MRAFGPLLLLHALGTVSGAPVVNGTNTCLDSTHGDYSCHLNPGELTIDMTGCGLEDNDIAELDACIEAENVKSLPITFIKLGNNAFTELPEDFFQPFVATLGHLHLEGNQLSLLPPKIFAGMSLLVKLHLQQNNLTTLPSTLFDGLVSLEDVDLSSNPHLQCVPSTAGTRVKPGHLILPDNFTTVQCDGPTPAPTSITPAPTEPPAPGSTPSPTKAPTHAPTPSPTPAPTVADNGGPSTDQPTTVCKNGIPGLQVGDACCKPECTKCGGVDCSIEATKVGLTAEDCCVNTIISAGEECGGKNAVVAPCINYATVTPAPTAPPVLSCSVQDTVTACKNESECRQCMYATTIEQPEARKDCLENYDIDVTDPCSPSTAMICCLVEIGDNCLGNKLFVEYSLCYIEESSGGAECPDSLTCNERTKVSSTTETSAAWCLTPPLSRVGSIVVGATLSLVGAVIAQ